MSAHPVRLAAVSITLAAALGCGANNGSSAQLGSAGGTVSSMAPSSAAELVPYVALMTDGTASASGEVDVTTSSGATTGTCSFTALAGQVRSSALTTSGSGFGEFAVELVDAPSPVVKEIWVTVQSVSVHVAGQGWTTLQGIGPLAVDLLTLKDSEKAPATAASLGFTTLPAGTVTQIRLLLTDQPAPGHETELANYVVLTTGNKVVLKVPSGFESGVKILGPWSVAACYRTTVTVDFDGERSIWYHANGPETEWILRPVIHAKRTRITRIECPQPDGGATSGDTTTTPAVDGTTTATTPTSPAGSTVDTSGTSGTTTTTAPAVSTTTDTSGATAPGTPTTSTTDTPTTSGTTDGATAGTADAGSATATDGTSTGGSTTTTTGGTATTSTTGSTTTSPTADTTLTPIDCSVFIPTSVSGGTDLPSGTVSLVTGPTPAGGACSAASECMSGSCVGFVCAAGSAGTSCSYGAECLSGTCNNGSCAISDGGQRCVLNSDCTSGACTAGTCKASGTGLPSGASCTVPTECMSNACYEGACLGGLPDQPCVTVEDCVTGLRCVSTPYTTTKICALPMAQ